MNHQVPMSLKVLVCRLPEAHRFAARKVAESAYFQSIDEQVDALDFNSVESFDEAEAARQAWFCAEQTVRAYFC
jgi:hypothetical protein